MRIILDGYPAVEGDTILDKRLHALQQSDSVRKLLMHEPRGHFDMYGALLVEPTTDADLAVLFLHNQGYSTMCGHAVIALGRYAVDYGLVAKISPITEVKIECPCGLVTAYVAVDETGASGKVSFDSVDSFLLADNIEIKFAGRTLHADIAYGGAFYVLVDGNELNIKLAQTPAKQLAELGDTITQAAIQQHEIVHPQNPQLGFLYGTIICESINAGDQMRSRNACIFADKQIDRSPTGSGVSARLAAANAHGTCQIGERFIFRSILDTEFSGEVIRTGRCGPLPSVNVRVGGNSYYTGISQLVLENADPLSKGFLLL